MAMTGTSYGARNNKSTGYFKSIECRQDQESTTSEDTQNCAARICSAKT